MKLSLFLAFATLATVNAATRCTKKINFPIKPLTGVGTYTWQVDVFGIKIFSGNLGKDKLQHSASVLAEILDNDEDGCPDDAKAFKQLIKKRKGLNDERGKMPDQAPVLLLSDTIAGPEGHLGKGFWQGKLEKKGFYAGQMFSVPEVMPACTKAKKFTDQCYDATQEEIHHFIHSAGYSVAYPKYFKSEWTGVNGQTSNLTRAMDIARGGRIEKTPQTRAGYPAKAWYKYPGDCTYECQAIEYLWWGYLVYSGTGGGLVGSTYAKEFSLVRKADLLTKDKLLAKLFQDSDKGKTPYKLATRPVDGSYTGCMKCKVSSLKSHGGTVGRGGGGATPTTKATTKATSKVTTTTAKATSAVPNTTEATGTPRPEDEDEHSGGDFPPPDY